MSERSSVSIAEVLGDNYYIDKLTSSDYSPSVGDTVTITLMVNDVFGDPANGQTRTVTCTGGSFVSVNGSSITSSSSVEVTTSSSGTVTLGLSVSVADNIIVSDGRAECVVSSLSDSITNLIQVQEVSKTTPSISAGNKSVQTFTVTACPTGYSWKYLSTSTGWGTLSSVYLSGTTLTVTVLNVTNSSHSTTVRGVLVYYPTIWNI